MFLPFVGGVRWGTFIASNAPRIAVPLWVLVPASFVAWVVFVVIALRWGRQIGPQLRAARAPGDPVPFLDVRWPRWFKLADPKFVGLLTLGAFLGLCAFALVVLVIER